MRVGAMRVGFTFDNAGAGEPEPWLGPEKISEILNRI